MSQTRVESAFCKKFVGLFSIATKVFIFSSAAVFWLIKLVMLLTFAALDSHKPLEMEKKRKSFFINGEVSFAHCNLCCAPLLIESWFFLPWFLRYTYESESAKIRSQ